MARKRIMLDVWECGGGYGSGFIFSRNGVIPKSLYNMAYMGKFSFDPEFVDKLAFDEDVADYEYQE